MDSQKIVCFLEMAKSLNFSKSAENLFLSQSTVSRNISALEDELQLKLFKRNSKNVALTQAGQIIYDGFEELKARFEDIHASATRAQQGHYGEIRIGFLPEFFLDMIPEALNAFEALHPNIGIVTLTTPSQNPLSTLQDGSIDFFVGGKDLNNTAGYSHVVVGHRRIGLTISKSHALGSSTGPFSLDNFSNDLFATLPETAAPAQKNLLCRCAKRGFIPRIICAPDVDTIMLWIELRKCISILYYSSAIAGNPNLRFIEMDDILSTDSAIFWNNENLNHCKKTFIDFISGYHWPVAR